MYIVCLAAYKIIAVCGPYPCKQLISLTNLIHDRHTRFSHYHAFLIKATTIPIYRDIGLVHQKKKEANILFPQVDQAGSVLKTRSPKIIGLGAKIHPQGSKNGKLITTYLSNSDMQQLKLHKPLYASLPHLHG